MKTKNCGYSYVSQRGRRPHKTAHTPPLLPPPHCILPAVCGIDLYTAEHEDKHRALLCVCVCVRCVISCTLRGPLSIYSMDLWARGSILFFQIKWRVAIAVGEFRGPGWGVSVWTGQMEGFLMAGPIKQIHTETPDLTVLYPVSAAFSEVFFFQCHTISIYLHFWQSTLIAVILFQILLKNCFSCCCQHPLPTLSDKKGQFLTPEST